jgi:hypothetical protein
MLYEASDSPSSAINMKNEESFDWNQDQFNTTEALSSLLLEPSKNKIQKSIDVCSTVEQVNIYKSCWRNAGQLLYMFSCHSWCVTSNWVLLEKTSFSTTVAEKPNRK